MIWAIARKTGGFTIHFDDPQKHHRDELRGAKVWRLDREPDLINGETIDYETGSVTFSLDGIRGPLVAEIKAEAARRIEAFAPLWRQMNDLTQPDAPGAAERRRKINVLRDWSNDLESQLDLAISAEDVKTTRIAITESNSD